MTVGLVFVSHSDAIARGLVDLARQMAPTVTMIAAGGTDEGGIGTSFDKVEAAIRAADSGAGVLLIGDLGSAILTAETAVDLMDEPPESGVRVIDVPLVEGGVAAAVAAESGADLDAVILAAGGRSVGSDPAAATPDTAIAARQESGVAEARATLADPAGLHARPAANLVRAAGRFAARVTVNGVDASSLLALLASGLRQGAEVVVRAEGDDAQEALTAVLQVLASID